MLKHFIIRKLHSLLGFENYLFIFTIFKIITLRFDKRKREYLYFSKLFPKDSNVIIIGANTGITTIPMSKRVPSGKVFAIEPVLINFSTLIKIIDFYREKNVRPFNLALGDENKEVSMIMPVINYTKSHGLCHIADEKIEVSGEGIEFKVKMKKLDDISEISGSAIHGIKIVAQSYEQFVFKGAETIIKKNMPLIYCELWLLNQNRTKTMAFIQNLGYKIMVLKKGKLIDLDDSNRDTRCLFFVPKVNSNRFHYSF